MLRLICILLIGCSLPLAAQFTYVPDQQVPVRNQQGNLLSMPWSGGVNAPQFNTMDLNGDDNDDLVLFDRMASRMLTYLNAGDHYSYAPEYEVFFPEVSDWVQLRDFNCDGKKDLFTRETTGIVVYKNVTTGDYPEWERVTQNVLLYKNPINQNITNIFPAFNDFPAITDLDDDGDLDILFFAFTSNTIELYKNYSVERTGTCNSLDYERETRNYGEVEECGCGEFAFNGSTCNTPPHGKIEHSVGRALLVIDVDSDGDKDILLSEEECNRIFLLKNKGTNSTPVFDESVIFPESVPVDLTYPIPFHEDLDFDGNRDLIVSTGLYTKGPVLITEISFDKTTWLYRNTGSSDFLFMGENFFQQHMIDVGDNSVPAFFDVDGDGDLDLFISNNFDASSEATVFLYQNTGTNSSPEFQLADPDYGSFRTSGFYNIRIRFADMDRDGKVDLAFTATAFSDGETWLHYIKNTSNAGLNLSGIPIRVYKLPGNEANAHLGDVDGDGDPDMLLGVADGSLQYWKNTSTTGAPFFTLESATFLGFGSSPDRQNPSSWIADLDADGRPDLMISNSFGMVTVVNNFRSTHEPELHHNIIFNPKLNQYTKQNFGGGLFPTAANLFGPGRPAVVIGNRSGGLHILKHDNGTALPAEPVVNIYPNPVDPDHPEFRYLKILVDRPATMRILSVMGQELSGAVALIPNVENEFLVPGHLAPGLYLVDVVTGRKRVVKRLVVR